MVNSSRTWLPMLGILAIAGCADQPEEMDEPAAQMPAGAEQMPQMDMGAASVTIEAPMDGATVTGPNVTVRYSTTGVQIAPAGTMEAGTGHHHLFVDVDVTPMGEVIPAGVPGIIHLGMAQTEHVVEGLSPGEHRLIAVVADGMHIPLNPSVADTVTITVAAGGD
jgi:hypothetical protein